MKTIRIFISLNVSLKYAIIQMFLFILYILLQNFQLYILLRISEILLAGSSPSNITNVTNTSLSLTTLTPSALLQNIIQLHCMQQVCAITLIPYFT